MRTVIGSDHAGFEMKMMLAKHLRDLGEEVVDVGTNSADPVDYPDFAEAVGKAIIEGRADRGVLICGSGVGASVAANKIRGIRAGLVPRYLFGAPGRRARRHERPGAGRARDWSCHGRRNSSTPISRRRFTKEERHVRRLEQSEGAGSEIRKLKDTEGNTMSTRDNRPQRKPPIPCWNWASTASPPGWTTSAATCITSGELKRLIEQDGLGGVTSNPAIFEKAITGSTDYSDALLELQKRKDLDAMGVYEILAIKDIQDAADTLKPVYDRTKKRDGYVSLEVSPFLAQGHRRHHQGRAASVEGREPAEPHGQGAGHRRRHSRHPAAHQRRHQHQRHAAVRAGNVREGGARLYRRLENVRRRRRRSEPRRQRRQLLHQPHRQHGGRHRQGAPESHFRSEGTGAAEQPARQGRHRQRQAHLPALQGDFLGRRWDALAKKGAQTQRVLWASTSTKDPSYSGRAVHRRADRPRHGEHDSARDLRRVPRSRPSQGEPGSRHRRGAGHHGHARKGRHLDEEGHRRPGDAGREAVRRAVRQAAQHRRREVQVRFAGRSGSADLQPARRRSRRSFRKPSKTGRWPARCAACGRATPRCGPARTKAIGSDGSASPKTSSHPSSTSKLSRRTSRPRASSTRCCSAWAAPACVRKFCG